MEKNNTFKKSYIFTEISPSFLLHVLISTWTNCRIYIFDTSKSHIGSLLIKTMHKNHWITRVKEHNYPFFGTHGQAIDLSERIVNDHLHEVDFSALFRLLDSQEFDKVYKRSLVQYLSLLASVNQYVINNRLSLPVVFLSKRFHKVIQRSTLFSPLISIKYFAYWGWLSLKLRWLLTVFMYITHLTFQIFRTKESGKKFKFAISVPFPWATKFQGARNFTFLVDEENLTRENTVFLVEYPESDQFFQEYSAKGFNLEDATGLLGMRNIFKVSTLKFSDDFLDICRILLMPKKYFFEYESLISLLFWRVNWSNIVSKVAFDNYIYFNKEGKSQISTNIFLRGQNIKTHAYSQFIGGPHHIPDGSSYDNYDIHWSFLNPDSFYLNSQSMAESMLLHRQEGVKHNVIGNIFSEKIKVMRNKGNFVQKIKERLQVKNGQKVITIFDTTYIDLDNHYSNYIEANCFLEDMIKLAKIYPDCLFLLKPSKSNDLYLDKKRYWFSYKSEQIVASRNEFGRGKNTIMLDHSEDVIDIISISDVVLTNSFSSPTADALLAGIPAFWYQAKTDVSFSLYNNIPGLVVIGYDELTAKIEKSLLVVETIDLQDSRFVNLVGKSCQNSLTILRSALNAS